MSAQSELLRALEVLVEVLNERQTDYALVGGLGVAVRGSIRVTAGIDVLLNIPQIELPRLLDALADRGFRVDLHKSIDSWQRSHLLELTFGQTRVDWIKAILPVFQRILQRARVADLGGHKVRVADTEGLLLLKLIAFRPRDEQDICGMLAANPQALDLDWVRRELSDLTEADDPRIAQFEKLVAEFYAPPTP